MPIGQVGTLESKLLQLADLAARGLISAADLERARETAIDQALRRSVIRCSLRRATKPSA